MKKDNASKTKRLVSIILFCTALSFQLHAQIDCNRGQFYGMGSDGFIYSLTISGSTVTLGNTVSTQAAHSRKGLAIADFGLGGSESFYSSGTNTIAFDYDILQYIGTSWQTLLLNSWTNPLHNAGGKGNFLYYQYIGASNQTGSMKHSKIFRFDGTTLSMIYSDTTVFMQVADVAVDNSGNVYFFSGPDPFPIMNTTHLNIISSSGNLLASYPVAFNSENAYGCFIEDSILYIGIGPSNPVNPNTLLPITISNGTATAGTAIPVPHPIIGGTLGQPIFLNFSDLASCASSKIEIPLSISSGSMENEINIFPNPANDILIVESYLTGIKSFFTIYNTFGKVVMHSGLDDSRTVLDISELDPGIYFVQIENGNKKIIRKFNKQ